MPVFSVALSYVLLQFRPSSRTKIPPPPYHVKYIAKKIYGAKQPLNDRNLEVVAVVRAVSKNFKLTDETKFDEALQTALQDLAKKYTTVEARKT
jgi:hypothetical protein